VIIAQPLTLRINEFLALNQSILTDEDGDYSDWIEIHNPTSQPINLLGWALTDDKSLPGQWIFPDVTIEINSYLIVFASGKNRKQSGDQLHTNFKISGNGEYLALNDPSGAAVSVFDPYFPVQQTDISFGLFENSYISFLVPTPGAVNLQTGGTLLSAPVFSRAHGFYDTPFNLEISCSDNEAKIYYTTNGSNPDATRGVLYSGPISIATTSIIRAIAIKDNQLPGKIATQTYLFLENVIHQANNPAGYPSEWGPYKDLPGNAIADYEMDPEMMADPVFANLVKDALLDLPTMSLITDKGLLFSNSQDPDTGGIYIYTGPSETSLGIGWERPVSLEYFDDKDSKLIRPMKSYKNFDVDIIYTGSFSKILGPGFRLGYMLASPEIHEKAEYIKQALDACTSNFMQILANEFVSRGYIEPYIKFLRQEYKERKQLMQDSLVAHMPAEIKWNEPLGGFYIWLKLPLTMKSTDIFKTCLNKGVVFVTGRTFDPDNVKDDRLRLSFSNMPKKDIDQGIRILAEAIRQYL